MGPFTTDQLMELLFRVRALRMVGSVTTDLGTHTFDHTFPRRDASGDEFADPAEVAVNRELLGDKWDVHTVDFTREFFDLGVWAGGVWISFKWFPLPENSDSIGRDENGKLWLLNATFHVLTDDHEASVGSSDFGGFPFTVDLVLSSGTVALSGTAQAPVGVISAASCAITATEWLPYATTTGAAAWNTATGAGANGGPGA
jgi:hypothetical protein